MNNWNLQGNVKAFVALDTATFSSDATNTGNVIDTTGYSDALVIVNAGVVTAGDLTPLVSERDGDDAFVAVPDDYLEGTEAAAAVSVSNTVKTLGVKITTDSIRVDGVADNSANLTAGITVLLYGARHKPVA